MFISPMLATRLEDPRRLADSPMAFSAFDVLEVDGQSVMGEPYTAPPEAPGGSARGAVGSG